MTAPTREELHRLSVVVEELAEVMERDSGEPQDDLLAVVAALRAYPLPAAEGERTKMATAVEHSYLIRAETEEPWTEAQRKRLCALLLAPTSGVSREAVLAVLKDGTCRCGHDRKNHQPTPYSRPCSKCAECPGYRPKIDDPIAAVRALPEAQPAETFQQRVDPWLLECFGDEIARDKTERNHRFLEESLELVQACGCTESEAHQLVTYVYGRPSGDPHQECGGVMVILAALCLANGIDMREAGEAELARIWTAIEKIRAKQASKPKSSALPEVQP